MGIALLTLADLFTPLASLTARWMAPRHDAPLVRHDARPSRRPHTALGGAAERSVPPAPRAADRATRNAACATRPAPPLRVIRVVEPRTAGQAASRVVISGRMADVCAELDRLAALEAHANGASLH